MTQAVEHGPMYRGRKFQTETIEHCVRWYITYRLSYRDVVATMAERGIIVSHTTIMRWVFRYVPEYERRWVRKSQVRPRIDVSPSLLLRWFRQQCPALEAANSSSKPAPRAAYSSTQSTPGRTTMKATTCRISVRCYARDE
jgi:hypothetical protein